MPDCERVRPSSDFGYGANNTEYRTEIDGFAKVVSYNTAGSGPEKFEAHTRDGRIVEYGYTPDSRLEAKGKTDVLVWAASKVSDTAGNYMTFAYTEDTANGDHVLARIDYTGNAGASPAVKPYASVRFSYDAVGDPLPRYAGGSSYGPRNVLTNVKTYLGTNTLVSDYRLAYSDRTAIGLYWLTSVSRRSPKCSANGQRGKKRDGGESGHRSTLPRRAAKIH